MAVIGNNPKAVLLDAASGTVHSFDQGDFVESMAFGPRGAYFVTAAGAVNDTRPHLGRADAVP